MEDRLARTLRTFNAVGLGPVTTSVGIGGSWDQPDDDHDEQRWMAIGFIDVGLHVVVHTEPGENHIRIISLRNASRREEMGYAQVRKRG